jgi:hypothetical protein
MVVDMRTALFIKSYAADFGFLSYCLKSINKFVRGIGEVIVAVQDEDAPALKAMGLSRERIEIVPRYTSDGYLDQEIHKLVAYRYTDAHQILFFDSDCIAIREFEPRDLLLDGKPRWLMTPYSKLVNADGSQATPWRAITSKALGRDVEWEFMRMHPLMVGRRTLIDFCQWMEQHHNCSLEHYIGLQPAREFSEWNAIGAWAYYYRPDVFSFWDTEINGVPEPFVRQFWSWGGLTPEIRTEMERLLA